MRCRIFAILLTVAGWPAGHALGWRATGDEFVSGIAIEKLPDDVPAFVRDPATPPEIAVMGRELDRSKGAGETHDKERDPGQYIDPGTTPSRSIVPLDKLPVTREVYDTQLRAGGSTQNKAGYLPYSVDGWQQIVKDFGYWRAAVKGAETAATPKERAWFEADRRLREKLTLRDIGVWSHYVGDASQPLHVSVHYNGWGNYPNPQGYTTSRIHAAFEGEFVRKNVKREAVAAGVQPFAACNCKVEQKTQELLLASLAQATPLYEIEKQAASRAAIRAAAVRRAASWPRAAASARPTAVSAPSPEPMPQRWHCWL